MPPLTDSRVVEAFKQPGNLERLLRELRCDTTKVGAASFDSTAGYIHCPVPGHADNNPSCQVLVEHGFFSCYSCCETVLPVDLIIAHGRAHTRGEAMRWAEDLLGIDTTQPGVAKQAREVKDILDPSLSVGQYIAMKQLSTSTIERFGLVDAKIWEDPEKHRKGYRLLFEKGYHGCVLMPTDAPGTPITQMVHRPRVRNEFGGRAPARVVVGREKVQFAEADPNDPAGGLLHRQVAYGIPQFVQDDSGAMPRTIIDVEGESDVHALHDMGIRHCLGTPGVAGAASTMPSIIGLILEKEQGDTARVGDWSIVAWSEPGKAGRSFPSKVEAAATAYCAANGISTPPRIVALPAEQVAGPDENGAPLDDPCDLLRRIVPLHGGSLAPAREEAGRLIMEAAFKALGRSAGELDPNAPILSVAPSLATLPPAASMQKGNDPWEAMGCDGALPAPEDLPHRVRILSAEFERIGSGWLEHYENSKREPLTRHVATIFDVAGITLIAGEEHVTLRAPRAPGDAAPEMATIRILRSDVADSRVVLKSLASIGVTVMPRCGPQATTLLSALAERELRIAGAQRVAETTGWRGKPGIGLFAGIECDTSAELGSQMFQANERRRKMRPDTMVAAREWWDTCAAPLLEDPDERLPRHAAPLLAIGAAAAAPLLGPLTELGIGISPVIWMAGMGGGGKSVTQKVCSAIFAPDYADLDGQEGYDISSNISIAAIGARADSLQDLPIVLDDIGNLPPSGNSKLTGEAATIYAGAELGMMLFNRDRAQRATRDGKTRKGSDFRSTAIFSTELEMGASSSRSTVKAGHFRRITAMDAKPMVDRGLGREFAESVVRIGKQAGGAPGDLLVAAIRDGVESGAVEEAFLACREAIEALPGADDVDLTQRESLTISMMGFVTLAESIGVMVRDDAIVLAAEAIAPFVLLPLEQGGAMKGGDITGVDRAVRAVQDMYSSHPGRFDSDARNQLPDTIRHIPHSGFLGKDLGVDAKTGLRRVVMTNAGTAMLEGKYGVSDQAVAQAELDGVAKRRHSYRMSGQSAKGTMWRIPSDDEPDDPGLPEPFDHDPQGLKEPLVSEPDVDEEFERMFPTAEELAAAPTPDKFVAMISAEHDALREEQLLEALRPLADEFAVECKQDFHGLAVAKDPLVTVVVSDALRRVVFNDPGAEVTGTQSFNWASGTYTPRGSDLELSQDVFLKVVRDDSWEELEALRDLYPKLHEANLIADPPPLDDPRWVALEAKGQVNLRYLWEQARSALADATVAQKDSDERIEAQAEHARLYRLHILARMHRPEWFIDA